MKPKYRAALFDLDDTVFDHQANRREALAAVARTIPELSVTDVRDLEAAHDVHLQITHVAVLDGTLSIVEARIKRMQGMLGNFGIRADVALANRCEQIYREAYDREWHAVPGAPELLRSLRQLGVWLGIITNGLWSEQTTKLRRLGLESEVDEMIVSELVGAQKPAREFFTHAVARTGVAPSQCIVIGDLLETDIKGALDFGLDSIWLNRYGRTCEPHPSVVEITSLTPLETTLQLFVDSASERKRLTRDASAASPRPARSRASTRS
jgi:putative hydrolase of the HAD superfamily